MSAKSPPSIAARELPVRHVDLDDAGHFEELTRLVFQTGFRWEVVNRRWEAFRRAFRAFDPQTVAAFDEAEIAALMADEGIVRNELKIRATIENAGTVCDLIAAHGSMRVWVEASRDLPWPDRLKAVCAPFRFLGPVGAHFYLWTVGEDVEVPGAAGN